jgi:hypothetical protein
MADNYRRRGPGGKLPYQVSLSCDPLFTSNTLPMREQLEEIRESALVARTLKCSLEQQITATRMQLLRLEREEMHAVHHIERCKFLLAPIRRIPNALYLCATPRSPTHPAPMSNAEYGFWSTFTAIGGPLCSLLPPFGLPSDIAPRWRTRALAEEYLRRSGNSPLSIEFRYSPDDVPPQHLEDTLSNVEDASKEVFDALLTRSPQWKAANLKSPCPFTLKWRPLWIISRIWLGSISTFNSREMILRSKTRKSSGPAPASCI